MKFWIGSEQRKERERFYLLAGMGGKAARRKHKIFLIWAIVAGVVVSAVVATLIFYLNRSGK